MSANIAPENLSVGVTLTSRTYSKPVPTSRPIEDAGASSADANSNKSRAFGRKFSDGSKAEPGTRPPGKDPSVLPQSLFDAALIASEYKPQTRPYELPQPTEPTAQVTEQSNVEMSSSPTPDKVATEAETSKDLFSGVPVETDEPVARLSA